MRTIGTETAASEETVTEETNAFDNIESTDTIKKEDIEGKTADNASLPGITTGGTDGKVTINYEKYDKEELVITPDDKQAFISAMLTGDRYYRECSLFGGNVKAVIRSRTTRETQAMYSYIRHMLAQRTHAVSTLEGDMQYLLLLVHVEELNGVKFPTMKEPLNFTETAGKLEEPGWLQDLKTWKERPEGLTSALINRIQLFEFKYWTMVKEASNKNFWKSDTSISG